MLKINLLVLVTLSACSHLDTPETPPPTTNKPQIVATPTTSPSIVARVENKPVTPTLTPSLFKWEKGPDSSNYVKRGFAAWYGLSEHGAKTASGEGYDLYDMTAAHASLPLLTRVRVTNLRTGKSIVVTINDRFNDNQKLIKLSYHAARRLGLLNSTSKEVEVRGLKSGN